MPINGIITQPAVNAIRAAYRPMVLRVRATGVPPVVYCDIYIAGIYYKTLSKTQYAVLGAGSATTDWDFDISDAIQEYLGKHLEENGGDSIVEVPIILATVTVKFRSSAIDAGGFLVPEGPVPVQGTGGTAPVSGGGTLSNVFYGVNATLQHEDNQDLATHLDSHKKGGDWDATSYPLSHRPNNYKVCVEDSDFLGILTDMVPARMRVEYMLHGSTVWEFTEWWDIPCDPVTITSSPFLPNGNVSVPYSFTIDLGGPAPFNLTNIVKPAWMTIAVVGSQIQFGGTPDASGAAIAVSFDITNCGSTLAFADTIDVGNCTDVVLGALVLPDAEELQPYNQNVPITAGTAPFALQNIVAPAWMTVSIVGTNVNLSGTPPLGSASAIEHVVEFEVTNCSTGLAAFNDSIKVDNAPGQNLIVRMEDVLGSICATSNMASVYTSTGQLAVGLTVYTDAAMTTPFTGWDYVVLATMGMNSPIYQIDSITGNIFADTGLTC